MGRDGHFDRKAKEGAGLLLGQAIHAPGVELDELTGRGWWVRGCGCLEDCGVICGGTAVTSDGS